VSGAAGVLPPEEGAAALDEAAEPLPEEGAAALDEAAEPLPEELAAARAWAAELRPGAGQAAEPVSEVAPRPAARGAQEVLLLAAAWAGLLSTRPQGGRPAPSAAVAHARAGLRTAQP
jgi:hypothetical protein